VRIDLALKYLCLAKSRSAVKAMCDNGAVTVNDRPAKPSSILREDDRLTITTKAWTLTISILTVPEKQLSKTVAPAYYRVVERTRTGGE
jgi:ribosomal 50S subunit-recycling heat shock protein